MPANPIMLFSVQYTISNGNRMVDNQLKPVKHPQALYETVQEAIKDFILKNGLKTGDPLPSEIELSKQLGVSRNSVREAVKALQLVGFVESRRGTGIFVGEFSLDIILDSLPFSLIDDVHLLFNLIEVRRVLEVGMIGEVVESADEVLLAKLENILARMEVLARQDKKFVEEDRLFHQALYENLDNQVFTKLLNAFWFTFDRMKNHLDLKSHPPIEVYQRHICIFNAVKARDKETARRCLAEHYAIEVRS